MLKSRYISTAGTSKCSRSICPLRPQVLPVLVVVDLLTTTHILTPTRRTPLCATFSTIQDRTCRATRTDSDEPRTQLEKAEWETASVSITARILPLQPCASVLRASAPLTGEEKTTHNGAQEDDQQTRPPLTRRIRSATSSAKHTVVNVLNQPLPTIRFGV